MLILRGCTCCLCEKSTYPDFQACAQRGQRLQNDQELGRVGCAVRAGELCRAPSRAGPPAPWPAPAAARCCPPLQQVQLAEHDSQCGHSRLRHRHSLPCGRKGLGFLFHCIMLP